MTDDKPTPNRHRLTVEFNDLTASRLKQMKEELGLDSLVQVIRLGVNILSYLLKETQDGWHIVLRKDGRKTPELIRESGEEKAKCEGSDNQVGEQKL